MEDQISSSIRLSIDIILTALILGIVIAFVTYANSGFRGKMQYNSTVSLLESKKLLYDYDNRIVVGSDIVEVITANSRLYNFEVITSIGRYKIDKQSELSTDYKGNVYGLSIWSREHILNNVLGDNVFKNFKSTLTRNESQGTITGVKLVQEGVEG